jgi:polar amino acid transport system permease protein
MVGRFIESYRRWMRRHLLVGKVIGVLEFLIASGLIIWLLAYNTARLGYDWQWYRVPRYLYTVDETGFHPGILLKGLLTTLKISGISLMLSFLIGLTTALLRLSRSYTAELLARIYLEGVRNTPLLIQLFVIYFVASPLLGITPFVSAVLALSMFEGAYASEIIRGGILSIPRGQWEASYSIGLSALDSYRLVILPQALRKMLPPLAGQAVSLVKDSALVSTIAIFDLTMYGQAVVSETFLTFEIWFIVAAIYLIVTITLSTLTRLLEKRMRL